MPLASTLTTVRFMWTENTPPRRYITSPFPLFIVSLTDRLAALLPFPPPSHVHSFFSFFSFFFTRVHALPQHVRSPSDCAEYAICPFAVSFSPDSVPLTIQNCQSDGPPTNPGAHPSWLRLLAHSRAPAVNPDIQLAGARAKHLSGVLRKHGAVMAAV